MTQLTILQISRFFDENNNICLSSIENDTKTIVCLIRQTVRPNADGTIPIVVTIDTCAPPEVGDGVDLCDDNFYQLKVYNRTTEDDRAYIGTIHYIGQSVLQKALDKDLWSCAMRFGLPINISLTL